MASQGAEALLQALWDHTHAPSDSFGDDDDDARPSGFGDASSGDALNEDVAINVVEQLASAVLSTPTDSPALAGERALQRCALFELDQPRDLLKWISATTSSARLGKTRQKALKLVQARRPRRLALFLHTPPPTRRTRARRADATAG